MNPIGLFWDIENCPVPLSKSVLAFVHQIRETFCAKFAEVEFCVVCDVKKEKSGIVDSLNSAQVNVIHVSATKKNAADEKLLSHLRKFGITYKSPGRVVLISSGS